MLTSGKMAALCAAAFLLAAAAVGAADRGGERRSDLWLKARIVTTYSLNRHLSPFPIDVAVHRGVVRLSGAVDSDVDRDLAVQIAKGVDGVRDVRDDIRVEPGALAGKRRESKFFRMVEDATITAKVKSKLLWNRNTSGLRIDVSTAEGMVTLTGKVRSGAEADLAVQLAKNTTGVEGVRSGLIVERGPQRARGNGMLARMEARADDAWITAKAKSMLLFSKDTENEDIHVRTHDRIVTLTGTVANARQKENIGKMVGNIVGVREVRSKLVIGNH